MIQPSSNIRVLLVDDDPNQLELLDISIRSIDESFLIESANSAEKALELIHNRPFDCIISDYVMPRMNGLELCERLRVEENDTPFILFTYQDDQRVVERAFSFGVDAFLGNEPNLAIYSVLVQKVNSLVSGRHARVHA